MGETTIGPGQKKAVEIWRDFKKDELHFVDILECCAVLMVSVADKALMEDIEILSKTGRIMAGMRKNRFQRTRHDDHVQTLRLTDK